MTLRLGGIFEALKTEFTAKLVGDAGLEIRGLAPLEYASRGDLSFLSGPRYAPLLARSNAACVIVPVGMESEAIKRGPCIVTDDPYRFFARVTQIWKAHHVNGTPAGVHACAHVEAGALIEEGASVGAFSFVAAGAVIKAGAQIAEHCVIGRDAVVGTGSRFAPRVTLGDRCTVGQRCIVHPGAVIGADGFGFAPHEGGWEKIEQLGAVRIGNDVEIGANTCIDRGALQDTVLEDGVKLDNLIQIGHNVHVGKHTAMAGCAGIAGSARIGAHCTIGGGAVVLGHLTIADHVHISAASVVMRSIGKAGNYTGLFPIDDNAAWEKNAATLKQLHLIRDRLRQVEKTIASMGAT